MATGNTQQIINYGASANDGTGDPLRTAFIKTDENFDNIWLAGPAGSNVRITNNSITTIDTNGNLILTPNGTGIIRTDNTLLPRASNSYTLGSSSLRYRGLYVGLEGINSTGNITTAGTISTQTLDVTGDLSVAGNLTVSGNIIELGNIVTDSLILQLANTASNAISANGAGVTVGANDDIATILYNSTSNNWTTNIGISATGNITAPYFIGNGSQLTGIASYANANAVAYGESGWAGNIIPSGNAVYSLGNATNQWNDLYVSNATIYMNNVPISLTAGNVLTVNGNAVLSNNSNTAVSTTGNITAGNVLTGGTVSATGNVTGGNILTGGLISATGNVLGAYIKGNGSELTNLPAPTVTQDISSTGAMSIMLYDGTIKYNNYATVEPSSGNITGGNVLTGGLISATGNITGGNVNTGKITLTNGATIKDTVGNAVAFGRDAAATGPQGNAAVAIGQQAGETSQGLNAVAIGALAGTNTQNANAVAIGRQAGSSTQGTSAVAVGTNAGQTSQGDNSVAIGVYAAANAQGQFAVAIGDNAGNNAQGTDAVAIGASAGLTTQGTGAVALGQGTGETSQGNNAVALGKAAGQVNQGINSIAIGQSAGLTNQGNNSIILNATGSVLEQTTANTFTVAPVRNDVANVAEILFYDTTSKEVTYGNVISVTGNITGNYILGNGSQLTSVNAVTVDVTDTNGLTTVYYPTFVENRTTTQIARADVDLTYRTDDNLLTVGNVSVTGNITGNTAGFAIGYRDIPQVSFIGNATIATADAGKHFYSTQSTDYILTIANNASQGFQTGAAITVVNQGTGNITLAQGSGVTLYLTGNATSGNRTVTTFGMATLIKVATDTWFVSGAGVI